MNCPNCGGTLKEKFIEGIIIQKCFKGCGIWFDSIEMKRIVSKIEEIKKNNTEFQRFIEGLIVGSVIG